jgi:urocanate hydratase
MIAGITSVIAEMNPKAIYTRHSQGWVNEVYTDINKVVGRVKQVTANNEITSIAFEGNIVDLWERFADENIKVDIGSDQTSLHNPWGGGYYPAGLTFDESNRLMSENPVKFREAVCYSLKRQVKAINKHSERGTYFFDYGNAFLLEASRAGADVLNSSGQFRYPSYVQDIMGPMCFDYGFGPFRWVCWQIYHRMRSDNRCLIISDG